MFSCKNCGAHELDNGKCAYCKTVYFTNKEPTIPKVLPETASDYELSLGYKLLVTFYCLVCIALLFFTLIP